MANVISDETMEYVGILAKLELSDAEKEAAKKDMESMLDYIDKLNELDTSNVEPMSHVFPVQNVFREDVVENGQAPEAGPPPHARAHGDALPGPDSCGNAHAGAVPRFHAAAQRRAGAGRRGPHPQRDAQAGQRRRLCGTGRRQHPKQHRAHRR